MKLIKFLTTIVGSQFYRFLSHTTKVKSFSISDVCGGNFFSADEQNGESAGEEPEESKAQTDLNDVFSKNNKDLDGRIEGLEKDVDTKITKIKDKAKKILADEKKKSEDMRVSEQKDLNNKLQKIKELTA